MSNISSTRTESTQRSHLGALALIGSLALLAITAGTSHAGTHVWSGAVSGYWSQAGNWSSGGVPAFGESNLVLRFPVPATRYVSTNNLSGLTVHQFDMVGNGHHVYGNTVALAPVPTGTNIFMGGGIGAFLHLPIQLPTYPFTRTYGVFVELNGTLSLFGAITGPGGLEKRGRGELRLGGDTGNTFAGEFRHREGLVELGKTSGVALPGPVFVGYTNASSEITLLYAGNHQIADAADVCVRGRNAELALDGYDDTIHSLELVDSRVTTRRLTGVIGRLRLNGDLASAQADTTGNWVPDIFGAVNLGDVHHTFNIETNSMLSVNANIESTTTNGGFTLVGGGGISLSGSNTFSGTVRIRTGGISSQRPNALGSPTGRTILEGGRLLMGASQTNSEPIDVVGDASIYAYGTNTFFGPLTVASNVTLRIDGGFQTEDRLTILGSIRGEGHIRYILQYVELAGSGGNTLSGTSTLSLYTKLVMNKTVGNALAGSIVLAGSGSRTPELHWARSHQVADGTRITIENNWTWFDPIVGGSLHLHDHDDTIGALDEGRVSPVYCGNGQLVVGGGDLDSSFQGIIQGNTGVTNLIKIGTGAFTLHSTQFLAGVTLVNAGKLVLHDTLGVGAVRVANNARLSGQGQLGTLTVGPTASIAPGTALAGTSYGTLRPATFSLGGGYLSLQLGGTNAGYDHDQIVVAGPINLNGILLQLSALNLPHGSNSFTLLQVPNGTATGTFVGLPEGAIFPSSDGKLFQITYRGGAGHDVVVTRHYTGPIGGQINGVERLMDGRIQILGTGLPAVSYQVQATTNFVANSWVNLGSVEADAELGTIEFIDPDAGSFSHRFYRFRAQ